MTYNSEKRESKIREFGTGLVEIISLRIGLP